MSEKIRLAMLALLKKLEWSGKGRPYDYGEFAKVCPVCSGDPPYDPPNDVYNKPSFRGHQPACELQAMIAALSEDE